MSVMPSASVIAEEDACLVIHKISDTNMIKSQQLKSLPADK